MRVLISILARLNYFLTKVNFRGSNRLKRIIIYFQKKLIHKIPNGIVIKTSNGLRIFFDRPDDKGVESWLFYTGDYERGTQHIIKKILNKGDSFVDIGANIGLMTMLASKRVGEEGIVYSFEPEKETFQVLQDNIGINKTKNIKIFNYGLSDKNEKKRIYLDNKKGRGGNSLIKGEGVKSGSLIELKKLDSMIGKDVSRPITMMKIDVEGWEINVLKGAELLLQSKNPPIICLEYSKELMCDSENTYEYLGKFGYHFYKLEKGKEVPSSLIKIRAAEDLPSHDNVFCFPRYYYNKAEEISNK